MPYGATSPRSPLSPRGSTSPFLVHSPSYMGANPSNNFLSAMTRSSSPTHAHHNHQHQHHHHIEHHPQQQHHSFPSFRSSESDSPGSPLHPSSSSSYAGHINNDRTSSTKSSTGQVGRHLAVQIPDYSEPESIQDRSFPSSTSPISPSYPYPPNSPFPFQDPEELQSQRHQISSSSVPPPAASQQKPGFDNRPRAAREHLHPTMGPYRVEEEVSRQLPHFHHQQHYASQSTTHSPSPSSSYANNPYHVPVLGPSLEHDQGSASLGHYHLLPNHSAPHHLSQPQNHYTTPSHHQHHQQEQQHFQNMPFRYYATPSERSHLTSTLSSSSSGFGAMSRERGPAATAQEPPYIISRITSTLSSTSSVTGGGHAPTAPAGGMLPTSLLSSIVTDVSVTTAPSSSSAAAASTGGDPPRMARRRRRPNESYSNIIIKAIRNSPLQRLKLSEIYDYVIREIPHMNGNDKGWQNTVRHNLSHNKCFKRILIKDLSPILSGSCEEDEEVSLSGRGKGSKQQPGKKGKGGYWVLVPEKLEESMSSSRPKKSSVDQGRLAPSPKRLHQQQEPRSMNMMSSMQNTDAQGLGFQQQQQYQQPRYFQRPRYDFALSSVSPHSAPSRGSSSVPWHQHQQHQQLSQGRRKSSLIDIDRDVASMTIAEQPSRYAPQHMHSTSSTPHHHHHQLHHQEAFYHQDHPSCENHDIEHYSFGYAPTSLSAAGERSEVENQERRRSSIGSGSHSPTHTSGGGDNEMSSGSDDLQSGRSDNSSSHIGNTGSDFDDLEDEELTPGGCGSGDATDLVAMEIDGSPSSSADVVVSGGRLSDSEAERMNIQEEDDNDTYVGTESKTIEDNSDTVFNLSSSPSSPSILGSGRGRGMSIQDILN